MSRDATADLYAAVRGALIADGVINGLVIGRVFSSWDNQEVPTPMIRMSIPSVKQFEMDAFSDGGGSESNVNVHVFTSESGPIACSQIASRVRDVLENAPLMLLGSDLFSMQYRDTIHTADPQMPSLQMAVVRFLATTTTK